MSEGCDGITVRTLDRIAAVSAEDWDSCAGLANPFVSHAFLAALEESGSVSAKTGWTPRHLAIQGSDGRLLACAPLYVKAHSFGEYVFDWSWAEAWQRAGEAYYPKLQCAVPFTPATGPRLLVRPGLEALGLDAALGDAMVEMARRGGLSSVHVTFPSEAEARLLAERGWMLRMGEQYHWNNRGYAHFDDFLAALSSRKRKTLRKEREQANSLGATIRTLTGDDIKPRHWDAFHQFYLDTVEKKWAHAYLNRAFFHRLGEVMPEKIALVIAERDGKMVAGALNLIGGDALYGRNWGSLGEFRFLHFEMCYYRAIDFAIEHKLARVEAGAQGEHKVSRGYLPVPTWSAHWIGDPRLCRAVGNFLEQERLQVAESIRQLTEAGPYREG